MKTVANKGFAVGSTVALVEDYITLFERFDLRNVICEVVDARRSGGEYLYRVSPVGNDTRQVEVYGDDLRTVRS
jgi:hypothetical protein